jgi:hypothetical protein
LQSYLADIAAGKVEPGARRRIPYGDGLNLFIAGRVRAAGATTIGTVGC